MYNILYATLNTGKESRLKNHKSVTPQSIPDVLEKPEYDSSNGLENQVESENQSNR